MLVAELPAGVAAYIDGDWLPPTSGEVPSLVVGTDGDPDTTAALAFLAVARAAVAAVEGDEPVEVTGRGLIAQQVRALLEDRSRERGQPGAVVETTGDPGAIVEATRRVAALGTVVLVGESLGRKTELNLYPDVHVRGLKLVGVPSHLQDAEALAATADPNDPLVESCRQSLVSVSAGARLPPNAAWYRTGAH